MDKVENFKSLLEEYENKLIKFGIYSVMECKTSEILENQYINSMEIELMRKEIIKMFEDTVRDSNEEIEWLKDTIDELVAKVEI